MDGKKRNSGLLNEGLAFNKRKKKDKISMSGEMRGKNDYY